MKDTEKATGQHVEMIHDELSETPKLDSEATKAMGTVKLTEGSIIYIPTPTADPQGMISQLQLFPEGTKNIDELEKILSTCLFGRR
jgi:hypothetical protein